MMFGNMLVRCQMLKRACWMIDLSGRLVIIHLNSCTFCPQVLFFLFVINFVDMLWCRPEKWTRGKRENLAKLEQP